MKRKYFRNVVIRQIRLLLRLRNKKRITNKMNLRRDLKMSFEKIELLSEFLTIIARKEINLALAGIKSLTVKKIIKLTIA